MPRLTTKSASETVFMRIVDKNIDGEEQPVEEETKVHRYFRNTYQIRLQHPMLPCVVVGKSITLPLEL
jgi:hypothetical protein